MPGFLLHVGMTAICPHGGSISEITSNMRVIVSGQPVVAQSDTFIVAGCPFVIPPATPSPCITVQWIVPATRVLINGQPALLQDSTGLCFSPSQVPQGPPNVIVMQIRVKGV